MPQLMSSAMLVPFFCSRIVAGKAKQIGQKLTEAVSQVFGLANLQTPASPRGECCQGCLENKYMPGESGGLDSWSRTTWRRWSRILKGPLHCPGAMPC